MLIEPHELFTVACDVLASNMTAKQRREVTAQRLYEEAHFRLLTDACELYVASRGDRLYARHGAKLVVFKGSVLAELLRTNRDHYYSMCDIDEYDADDQAQIIAHALAAIQWYRHLEGRIMNQVTVEGAAAWLAQNGEPEQMTLF